jgi:hypothetical protein
MPLNKAKRRKKAKKKIAQGFDQPKEVRAIARERVGTVKAARVIVPKNERAKPKHKRPPGAEEPAW